MTKSNGITSLKQAAKLLNKHSPDGESLAYINKDEAKLLRSHGGSGIMTVAGVPSYIDWGKWIDYGKKALEYLPTVGDIFKMSRAGANTNQQHPGSSMGTEYGDEYWQTPGINPVYQDAIMRGETGVKGDSGANPFWEDIGGSIMQSGKKFLKDRYGGVKGIKQGGKDVLATLVFLKGKRDTEGLNADEMKVFDELNQRTEAARAEFQANIAGGGATNIPTDVSRFTEVDLPDMITTPTAAEGGRIGAFNGGIQGLMPQQGMPQQGMPQQGLDPRMGYAAQGGRMGFNSGGETAYEKWLIDKYDLLVSDLSWDDHSKYSKLFRDQKAQGGRIGYNLGGIDRPFQGVGALNPRMGYAFGEQVTETVETPENIQMAGTDTPPIEMENLQSLLDEFYEAFGRGPTSMDELKRWALQRTPGAYGGRIGAQGGGIMPLLDMGGMEKDYRQDGGFVPIGRREKADDVPARLSKNEFVFTADAVKAAGGGDIDEGAQRMYNVMKNLEAGGDISEQSQGQG